MEKKRAVFKRSVRKICEDSPVRWVKDSLVAEEPFTLVWQSSDGRSERLASTMRTPGDDLSLAAGLLFSEGVLLARSELHTLSFCGGGTANELNRLKAHLRLDADTIRGRLQHRPSASLPQSACGLCAMDDLSSPQTLLEWAGSRYRGKPVVPNSALLRAGLQRLQTGAPLFSRTGASHATVLVGPEESFSVHEDVGRHNACDKAIGSVLLLEGEDKPFQLTAGTGVLVSSRLSFELAQKALAAGAAWMASVGAPTHLAVELAERCQVPVFGFLSDRRFNRYV
ncbi:MAG: formate dehydrogenase accessory sulfurtransferase FdhD [Vulcanimicrobiota bacterium]